MSRTKFDWCDWMTDLSEADAVLYDCDLFFVYGTLQSVGGNNALLQHSVFIGEGQTEEAMVLGDRGFPYAFPSSAVPSTYERLLFPIKGEIWKVNDPSTVVDLDGLEGHPDHYTRKVVPLECGREAWMYLQHDWSMASHCDACTLDKGVWKWRGY